MKTRLEWAQEIAVVLLVFVLLHESDGLSPEVDPLLHTRLDEREHGLVHGPVPLWRAEPDLVGKEGDDRMRDYEAVHQEHGHS